MRNFEFAKPVGTRCAADDICQAYVITNPFQL